MRATSRGRRALAAGVAVIALVGAGCSTQPPSQPLPTPAGTPAAPRSTLSASPRTAQACLGAGRAATGVFRETQPAAIEEFEAWLGCRVDYVVDYSARDTWQHIAAPDYLYEAWSGQPRRLVLGVAMLPSEDGDVDIESGARGRYDRYFRQLAAGLVASGQQDAVLRIGWEFNLRESTWYTTDAEAFTTYWRRIVEVMRSVDGAEFAFDWNPNNGRNPADAADYYPGDDVVDFVGVDAYDVAAAYPYPEGCDQSCRRAAQKRAWDEDIYGGERGLKFWRDFARQHGKQLSLPEWGLWNRPDGIGGGENSYYLEKMHAFIVDPANDVGYQAYFEFDGADGEHRLMTTFTSSGVLFRALFTRA